MDFLCDFSQILSPDGKEALAEDVSECGENDEKIRQLVQRIRTGLLIPMKAWGGKTPHDLTPSPHSGVEDGIDNGDPIENLESSNIEPIRNSQSQLRHRCLERDGNRCLATGHYSHGHAHPPNALTTHLQAAHILPFAFGSREINDSEAVKVDGHSNVWFNLVRYFPILGSISFTSEQINLEENALMLDSQLYMEFSQFRLIFEATGVAHQYRIKTFPDTATAPIRDLPQRRLVKFEVHKGSWELPDSKLLEIHACIGNFLHMSGQAERIDTLLRDFEYCGGLAQNGSTNIEDLLAVSSLSLLPSNAHETF